MDDHIKDQITKDLKETIWDKSRSAAFGFMVDILENGEEMSHQIRDLKEIVSIWKDIAEVRTVKVVAFSGMEIGILPIRAEHPDRIEVQTKNGDILIFDKTTKKQINAKNPNYANKIIL